MSLGATMYEHRSKTSHYHLKYSAMEVEDELMDSYACNYNFDHGHAANHRQVQTTASNSSADLQMLVTAFPEIDASIIQDIFIAKNYDVCGTAEALSGLMAPSTAAAVQSDTDNEDQWSYHDDLDEETASVGSLDWVVVHDEWDVAVDEDSPNPSCRSYSDVLVAPFAGNGVPFAYMPPVKPTRGDGPTEVARANEDKDLHEETNDYYGIKEYAQRRCHYDRTHPRKGKSVKAPASKKGK
ncbi:hypothetical protein ACHHYP_07178 [Achlya hypogyna]|uniref:CUE domain-containing protein n=1 Tax=Achlya hypogyna TaxID=1202772 RepID=A0A1V9ZMM6_ACHHY|nr:hypothetical protein ACHHYP_07178 [Achlya hypogyna]